MFLSLLHTSYLATKIEVIVQNLQVLRIDSRFWIFIEHSMQKSMVYDKLISMIAFGIAVCCLLSALIAHLTYCVQVTKSYIVIDWLTGSEWIKIVMS